MRESPDEIREIPAAAVGASPVAGLIRAVTSPWGERTFLRTYSIAIAVATFLSLTSALGTNVFPVAMRLSYWLVVMIGGTVATQLVSFVVERYFRFEPIAEAIALFLLSLPVITLTVWGLTALFSGHAPNPAVLRYYIGPVCVITLAMSVLQYLLTREPRQSHVFADAPTAHREPAQAFRARLPFKYRQAQIHALSAEDHYLRVHTSAGDTLVLMRLYDAIRELDGIEGSQTHRSWWVARTAVRDIERGDGRVGLRLAGNIMAPVSRTYQPVLKRDGWF